MEKEDEEAPEVTARDREAAERAKAGATEKALEVTANIVVRRRNKSCIDKGTTKVTTKVTRLRL